MRVDANERKQVPGRDVNPHNLIANDVFIDPFGVVWEAVSYATDEGADKGHVVIRARQIFLTEDNQLNTNGSPVQVSIRTDSTCRLVRNRNHLIEMFSYNNHPAA